jgi:hypothetical protein
MPAYDPTLPSEEWLGHQGEFCYNPGCPNWLTGASDYCSEECEDEAHGIVRGED